MDSEADQQVMYWAFIDRRGRELAANLAKRPKKPARAKTAGELHFLNSNMFLGELKAKRQSLRATDAP